MKITNKYRLTHTVTTLTASVEGAPAVDFPGFGDETIQGIPYEIRFEEKSNTMYPSLSVRCHIAGLNEATMYFSAVRGFETYLTPLAPEWLLDFIEQEMSR